mmetsp:Transcript_49790/g.160987  ORF Transcript_49790/g.160987 Transcript_49790/m.160987 type:complete len:201 (+) Transcript_49790:2771-3373(+)
MPMSGSFTRSWLDISSGIELLWAFLGTFLGLGGESGDDGDDGDDGIGALDPELAAWPEPKEGSEALGGRPLGARLSREADISPPFLPRHCARKARCSCATSAPTPGLLPPPTPPQPPPPQKGAGSEPLLPPFAKDLPSPSTSANFAAADDGSGEIATNTGDGDTADGARGRGSGRRCGGPEGKASEAGSACGCTSPPPSA